MALEKEGAIIEVLYWFGMVAMSLMLAAITVLLFITGIKFTRSNRKGLGVGSIIFSLVAAVMVILMINRQFLT
ncbi:MULTISPECIES: hypothetical protein [Paenibacillus]|uniref:Uncharacterized protein n=1 Tax=Paenibacillus apis TaxID=1792174 RepID=A0A919Y7E8_9BACL|nr:MULTISPECIES: hypothetical protein [Paenibacillus]GIO43447.1 hypothetical protein J41TS4_32050 [Paenibacillus apis]